MKKLFLTIMLTAFAGLASAQSTPTLSISDVDITPGGKAAFTLTVNVGDLDVTGFQCATFNLPEGLSLTENGTWNSQWDNTPNFGVNKDGDVWILNCYSGKDISIPQNQDFVLGAIEIEASDELTAGDVLEAFFPEGQFFFVKGNHAVASKVSFNINVNDFVTLDENSLSAPATMSANATIKVKRTIKAGEWSTICLPFAMNATNVSEVFDGAEIYTLSGYTKEEESGKITGLNVEFTKSSVIRANTPYIIKVNSPISEFTVANKKATPNASLVEIEDEETLEIYASMTGVYSAQTIVPKNSLFLYDNSFYYSTGLTKMKAFRAYFTFTDLLSSYEESASRIKFFLKEGDELTEIQIPELSMPADGEYYDLRGQRVDTPAKGIYIKDGKKVVVK